MTRWQGLAVAAVFSLCCGPATAQDLSLGDQAKKVAATLEARKKPAPAPEVPYFFGHLWVGGEPQAGGAASAGGATAGPVSIPAAPVVPVAPVQVAPVAPVQPAGAPAAPLPEIKCSGVMQMPSGMMVIVGSGTYKIGDEVQGCRIVNITNDEVTFDFQGRVFTKPTR